MSVNLDIVPAREKQRSVKLVEDHPPPAAVARLEDVESLQGLLAQLPLPLNLLSVQREELVARGSAVQPGQAVLQSDQHGVTWLQHPAVLRQHPLQLLHLHAGLQQALHVGLDGEDEVLYLDRVDLDRTVRASP